MPNSTKIPLEKPLNKKRQKHPSRENGSRWGRLVIVSFEGKSKGAKYFLCQCDCGNTTVVQETNLIYGFTQSCGCFRIEKTSLTKTTHGMSQTSIYQIWIGVKKRCLDPRNENWLNYGGRGISVCERWMNFENFLTDMGEKPEGMSLDRINNDGNYEPNNCRWATPKEQGRNKRNNHILEFNSESKPVSEWAEITGISRSLLSVRLKHGWSIEKTLTTKPKKKISYPTEK